MWLFDASQSKSDTEPSCTAIGKPKGHPRTFWGNQEEQRAIDYYLHQTGPWLANYAPHGHRPVWESLFPRIAVNDYLPATRHMITAVALLDSPVGSTDPDILRRRANLIMKNYTQSLHALTSNVGDTETRSKDMGLAPVMGWLLESLSWNEPRAAMHEVGARTTLDANKTLVAKQQRSGDDYILDEKWRLVLMNVTRFRCVRCKIRCPIREDDQMYFAVCMRNLGGAPTSTAELRSSFRDFFRTFNPTNMTADEIATAEEFARRCELAVYQSRHESADSLVIWNALHFLANVTTMILPIPISAPVQGFDDPLAVGTDYIFDRCYWYAHSLDTRNNVKEALDDIIDMLLQLIASWGPDEGRRLEARQMLQKFRWHGTISRLPLDFEPRRDSAVVHGSHSPQFQSCVSKSD